MLVAQKILKHFLTLTQPFWFGKNWFSQKADLNQPWNQSIYFLVYILVKIKPPSVGQIFLGIAPRATQEVNVEWSYNAGLEFVFLLLIHQNYL